MCFTPFNKQAMRLAQPPYEDEIGFTSGVLGFKGAATEFNILEGLWNARVTSHIPLAEVSSALSVDAIVQALELTATALRAAGFKPPRIGVAALNPHAGDGGNFGREEIDIIEPAVKKAKAKGLPADGPYPADTVFVRAKAGQFDAVLTMFHDQGQIAMKLLGFDRGVTLLGGYPFPICTPAHGTAYDIAGKGVANVGAARAALLLAAKMASVVARAARRRGSWRSRRRERRRRSRRGTAIASTVPNAGSRCTVKPAAFAPTTATPRFQQMNASTEAISAHVEHADALRPASGIAAAHCSAMSATAGSEHQQPASEITNRNAQAAELGGRRLSSTE